MIYETQEQLDAALAYWQKVLRLQDWRVTATIERMRDIPLEGRQGYNRIHFPNKTSRIMLLDPADYPPASNEEQDHEETVVHELLHLHVETLLNGICDEQTRDWKKNEEEQCVELIAEALVGLNRHSV